MLKWRFRELEQWEIRSVHIIWISVFGFVIIELEKMCGCASSVPVCIHLSCRYGCRRHRHKPLPLIVNYESVYEVQDECFIHCSPTLNLWYLEIWVGSRTNKNNLFFFFYQTTPILQNEFLNLYLNEREDHWGKS